MKTLDTLFVNGKTLLFKKKEIIFSPSLLPQGMYQLKKGYIYGYSLTKDNKKRIQTILKPGEIFPILWNETGTFSRFYVESLTPVTVSLVDKDVFFTQVYADKDLTQAFIHALTSYLSTYVDRVENLELETLSKKVVGRLLHYASKFGIKKEKTIFIQFPLTHELIAQSINVSRENVSRELMELENDKLIAFQGKNLLILNSKKLAQRL